MTTARDHPGVVGVNGKLYVFGGSNASGALSSVEIYDPATNTWTAGPSMPGPKSAPSAVVVNGLIYVLAGNELVYRLDPQTGTWSTRAPVPVSFSGPAAVAVLDGKIYLTQGSQWMYQYNPVMDSWTAIEPVPVTRSIASFAVLNGKIYAIGGNAPGSGRTEIARIDVYDPVTNSWILGGAASLSTPRTHLGSPMPVVNGRIYVIGGWDGYSALTSVEEYDPTTNTWRYVASMPMARYGIGYGVLDNRIYAIGGNYGGSGGHWQTRNDEFTTPSASLPEIDLDIAGSPGVVNRNLCSSPVLSKIVATIKDLPASGEQSGLDWIRLYYSLNGEPESYMEIDLNGEMYKHIGAYLGPFEQSGIASWYIVARDRAGNQSQSPVYTIIVNDCPFCTSWLAELPARFVPVQNGFRFENFNTARSTEGTCLGMAVGALDFFEYQYPIPEDSNYWGMPETNPDDPLICYIVQRHLEANSQVAWYRVLHYTPSWLPDPGLNWVEYEKIRERIRGERRVAVAGLARGTDSHAVDVYAVSECGNRVVLYTYDPNEVFEFSGAFPHLIEGTSNTSVVPHFLQLDPGTTEYNTLLAIFDAPLSSVNPSGRLQNCDNTMLTAFNSALEETAEAGYLPDSASIVTGLLDQSEESPEYPFVVEGTNPLAVIVSWAGSTFRLSVYRPDGSLFREIQGNRSPLVVPIPAGEPSGVWKYRVTAISVPHEDYPFIGLVGRSYLTYLPVIMR